jgi:hypothetical protein
MGRNVGKRACWAGENRHVYSKYYAVHKKERDGQAWLEEKKKGGGSQIVTASHCGGGDPRNPLLETNSWAGFPSQKKKKKERKPMQPACGPVGAY